MQDPDSLPGCFTVSNAVHTAFSNFWTIKAPVLRLKEKFSLTPRTLICSLLFLGAFLPAIGQTPGVSRPLSNLRQKWVQTNSPSFLLDTLSLVPNSVQVSGIHDSLYTVDPVNARISWRQTLPFDSVLVRYRVFPGRLNASVQRMVFDSVMNNFMGKPYVPDFGRAADQRFFEFGDINYNGSFGRGIAFGNSQDAVVTSNLNLQLSGYLADSIEIAAAITDNNIPIQPDGTTQQLNEFDKIYLSFKKKNWQLSLGDIDIRQNQSYFVSFYKRLQGIAFETTSPVGPHATNRTLVSGSIAKGKFTRNVFQGQEGNQGPYRLTGANNEFFFVVLANTERVYIDGELLQRGEDQDYVINYNTAEIAFTPKRMITKDSRIQVEFEYSDRNFLNANLYGFNETNLNDKLKIRVSAFNNSDSRNSPINQTLNPAQKTFLDSLGGNINQAFYPNASLDTFSAGKILYKKIDTLYNGFRDSIYVFSNNRDSARYNLSFLDVGQGNGNYLPDFNGANGKVFRWIQPLNGIKQGRFEPALFLVTPKKQQVFSTGVDYQVSKSTLITTELGMSNYDVNTFSIKDNANNKGYAGRIQLKNTRSIGAAAKGKSLLSEVSYEQVSEKFKPLERLRSVEFYRDWSLPYIVPASEEKLLNVSTQLADKQQNSIRYQFTNYRRAGGFNGFRNALYHVQDIQGWKFSNQFVLSSINSADQQGYFLRPTISVMRKFSKWKNYSAQLSYSSEQNEMCSRLTDSITAQSFSFNTIQASIRSAEDKPNKWGITYFTRADAYPVGKELLRADRSQNISLFTELLRNENRQLRVTSTYRNLKVERALITGLKPDQSLLGRAEYQFNEWKGLVTGNLLYEVGAGQEQKRDYAFLEVPAGQGEYTWNDYDGNGIQSLNEFEIALFPDQAKYIRIFTPTNEFIKANYNQFNYFVALNPKAVAKAGSSNFVSRLNFQSTLQINKKELARGLVQLNPFSSPLTDTSLITLNQVFVNTFSFNRFSTRWGLDINNARNSSKALLTYGYESRATNEWSVKGRVNISKEILIDLTGRIGTNRLSTSNVKFDNRNYDVLQRSAEPKLTLTRGATFRVITGYRYGVKTNTLGDQEQAVSHSVNTEVKYNILQSTSLLTKFTFSNIDFTSSKGTPNANSTTSYILLEGLMPGKNYLWNVDLTKRLSNSLEINIQYEGRKPGTSRVVHVGRAAIRAIL